MCLSYTNHALDNFLESLLEAKIPEEDIVRLGGSTGKVSEKLQQRCLKQLEAAPFNPIQRRQYGQLKDRQKKIDEEVASIKQNYLECAWGTGWWSTAEEYFNHEIPDVLDQFQVRAQSGGFREANRKGKALTSSTVWDDWLKGRPKPVSVNDGNLWAMSFERRQQQCQEWCTAWKEPHVYTMSHLMKEYAEIQDEINTLRDSAQAVNLAKARIVGCTTTSAAKNSQMLADLAPEVVLVEEAAEIFEAQVLTALNLNCQHLIMIGDHLQLRPKAESFNLRVEGNQGFDIDVSLFERLVKGKYKFTTLDVQHRMRPEISKLVRKTTYPELKDGESVKGRDNIRGLQLNVVFVDHNHPEESDEEKAALGSKSYINMFEVRFTVAVVKYLLQQGYKPEDIGRLTACILCLFCKITLRMCMFVSGYVQMCVVCVCSSVCSSVCSNVCVCVCVCV